MIHFSPPYGIRKQNLAASNFLLTTPVFTSFVHDVLQMIEE